MINDPSASPTRDTLTRVAAHASAPVSASVDAARISIGFVPRLLAYLVKFSWPCPTGMATTSGAMPGNMTAGARTEPCADAISTTSPSAMPSLAAVCGFSSTQLLHIADVNGSGSSWSHGRCAEDPSPNAIDAYGRKWYGYVLASPANVGSA